MIDYNKLRKDLIDFYGSGINYISFLVFDMINKIENASNDELLEIAKNSNFNLNNYKIYTKKL